MPLSSFLDKDFLLGVFEEAVQPAPGDLSFRLVERSEDRLVVLSPTQGTAWSWLWNFVLGPLAGLHLGFGLFYILQAGRIKKALSDLKASIGQDKLVIFTGFSRGGALAEMLATDEFFKDFTCLAISFAGPKWTVRSRPDKNVLSFKVYLDPVCYLPPWPFKHLGRVYWIKPTSPTGLNRHRFSTYREALRSFTG